MKTIKDMVKGKNVIFERYKDNILWYKTECGFLFPVPINDIGDGIAYREDKALLYMRWIRKHFEMLQNAKTLEGIKT